MGREISIFSDYKQGENSLTNYCGLLMKLLYEDSPRRFEDLIAALVSNDSALSVGPRFAQQTKMVASVPDLSITQKSFSILFETKNTDWFYKSQIESHLKGFPDNVDYKVLFLLSNFDEDDLDSRFSESINKAKKHDVVLQPISFEDFVGALEAVCTSDHLITLLEEFKVYLDRSNRLPKWKYLLDVVNCAGTKDEIRENVYMCPDTGGAYSHRKAKYFGAYAAKKVYKIFEIKAVVVIGIINSDDNKVVWRKPEISKESEDSLIVEAKNQVLRFRAKEHGNNGIQVFLLENGAETKFIKDTSGGMMQSKKYFWDIAKDCNTSLELAKKLNNKNWGDFNR